MRSFLFFTFLLISVEAFSFNFKTSEELPFSSEEIEYIEMYYKGLDRSVYYLINEEDIFLRRLDETSEKNDLESSSATYAFLSETDNKNYKINMAGNSHDVYVVNRRGE
uniref:hypothetical protein n=1 Tax=Thaumasiovibrio subtropicus TaxID=1891207 RepID=UPI00131E9A9A